MHMIPLRRMIANELRWSSRKVKRAYWQARKDFYSPLYSWMLTAEYRLSEW